MVLPQFPTDNLYKFIFIAGLTIIGASTFLYVEKYGEIKNKYDIIETDLLNIDLAFYTDSTRNSVKIQNLKIILQKVSEEFEKLKKDINSNNQKSVIKPRFDKLDDDMLTMKKLESQCDKFILEFKISSHIKHEKISHKLKILDKESKLLDRLFITSGLFFICGFSLSFYGGQRWYTKVQKIIDEKLICELDQIKRDII